VLIPVDMAVRTAPPARSCAAAAWPTTCAGPSRIRSTPDLDFDFDIPTSDRTDALGRYLVRMQELEQSSGSSNRPSPCSRRRHPGQDAPETKNPGKGEVYFAVEGARGKIGCYLQSDGGPNPYRVKLRAPSFSNLSLFAELSQGTLLADAVSILGSLDLVIPEIDR
jgi:NADH-quinone oxidoreductase subunit D